MQKFAQATTITANHRYSLALGLLGVLGFSLTLPATRLALQGLEPVFVGLGRALIAAMLAAIALWITRSPLPSGRQWLRLACTALGVVVGFPLLTAFAMETVPAVHGAVIVGLIPLTTALFAIQLAGERPNWLFWLTTLIGCAVILVFAFSSGAGALQSADIMLLIGVAVAGYGYAEGARLSKEIGAWQTISWALLVSVPVLLPPAVMTAPADIFAVEWVSLLGFAYVSIVSMYLAFIAWYQGLALGGIAQIGQLQLLQPFLTLLSAALILGESVETSQLAAALIVLSCVAVGRRAA